MANTYLTRTPSSGSNRQIFTLSFWAKISNTESASLMGVGVSQTEYSFNIICTNNNKLSLKGYTTSGTNIMDLATSALHRDCSGWYNFVMAFDTTQATEADRVKIYVNGVLITAFDDSNYPAQYTNLQVNNNTPHRIGCHASVGQYWQGSMSYVALVDGTQELPTIFGETDSVTGQWKIKTGITPSVAWGTNGFLILKNGNSLTDESTNTNNFTLGSGTLTNTLDCPSNVFSTMNRYAGSYMVDFANGNTSVIGGSASNNGSVFSTLSMPDASGKYYFEVKFDSIISSDYSPIAILKTSDVDYGRLENGGPGDPRNRVIGMAPSGIIYNGSSATTGVFPALSNGDIVSFAYDMDNGAYYMSINGAAYLTSGDPTSGASRTGALVTWTPNSSDDYGIWASPYNASIASINFGNGYFGTTAVATAGTTGSTPGVFEYDVPSGYEPLSTKGLNA